jgi:hypothetical protein
MRNISRPAALPRAPSLPFATPRTAKIGCLLLAFAAAGCGSAAGKVSGKVTIDGKPLPGGVITFVPTDPNASPKAAEIDASGEFHDLEVAAGDVAISVENRSLGPKGRPNAADRFPKGLPPELKGPKTDGGSVSARQDAPKHDSRFLPIPERYYDTRSSGLRYTVIAGPQTHNVELTK